MIDNAAVELSRLQFGLTAMYHFLFVPLTLGLSVLLGIMESVYVMTGRTIWRDMTKYWGLLFGINFAMGVATGHHHGIPVRHELGLLLALCRRHLRRAAGDRRSHGLLSRGEFRRAVLLRLGPDVEGGTSDGDLAAGARHATSRPCGSWLPMAGCRIRSARCSIPARCAWS